MRERPDEWKKDSCPGRDVIVSRGPISKRNYNAKTPFLGSEFGGKPTTGKKGYPRFQGHKFLDPPNFKKGGRRGGDRKVAREQEQGSLLRLPCKNDWGEIEHEKGENR